MSKKNILGNNYIRSNIYKQKYTKKFYRQLKTQQKITKFLGKEVVLQNRVKKRLFDFTLQKGTIQTGTVSWLDTNKTKNQKFVKQ